MAKGSTSGQAEQSQQHTTDTGSKTATGTGSTNQVATFDPRADETIKALQGATGNVGSGDDSASSYLQGLLSTPNGQNPYAQQVVDTQDKLANATFDKRLGAIRSSNYGSGAGSDLVDQGMFTGNFTDQQKASDAKTLLDAFNNQQSAQLTGAGQLAGIDATKMASALNLINALRGQSATTDQQTNESTTSRSDTAGQKTAENVSASAVF